MSLPLVVCGLNHKTAPVEVREKFFFAEESLTDSLKSFVGATNIQEVVLLSTCNRTEVYAPTKDNASVLNWLANSQGVAISTLEAHSYIYQDQDAVKHALRVAGGLDSLVVGEPQILGQVKKAVHTAHTAGTLKGKLKKLFDHTFYVARQIRNETEIGANPISLGYAILHLAKNIFAELNRCRVLLIGAGEIIGLVAKYFQTQGITEFFLANRTFSNAETLALPLHAKTIALQEIADYLPEVDIVVSAIHTLTPLLGKGMIETTLKRRRYRPLLMVDLAVPRNMEREIKSLEGVYLIHLDELQSILEENYKKRRDSIKMAEKIINLQTDCFYEELNKVKTHKFIQKYRAKMHNTRDEVLQKALRELEMGDAPEEVLKKMAYVLTNKLLHDPCVWLKETL